MNIAAVIRQKYYHEFLTSVGWFVPEVENVAGRPAVLLKTRPATTSIVDG
jgi:hypothetical protein